MHHPFRDLTKVLSLVSVCWALAVATASAGMLPPQKWHIIDSQGRGVRQVTDNDLETVWTSDGPQRTGLSLAIDLREEAVLHRVFLTPGKERANFPRSIRVLLSNDPFVFQRPRWQRASDVSEGTMIECSPRRTDWTDLKFSPVRARYVRLEIGRETCGLPWSIAELEVYGSTDEGAFVKRDAVVVDPDAPFPLKIAARELRYYVGELTGRPLPIISPESMDEYPGTLYRVVNLAPLAKTHEEMVANQAAGKLPKGVNVERKGREVLFRAWPYEMVLSSVWEFLERQGVRWVYPDPHGDFVPAGKGVNLDLLPLKYEPPVQWRYANFNVSSFCEEPAGDRYLYFWRNRWNSTWGGQHRSFLGGGEEPKPDEARVPRVGKGFEGYPHNFASVVPEKVLREHPDWCGMLKNTKYPNQGKGVFEPTPRRSPGQGGPTFCMSNPELIEWVAQKAIDSAGGNPSAEGLLHLLPMDSAQFCECDNCMKLYEPVELERLCFEWGGRMNVSDAFYHFVSEVAKRIQAKLPKVQIRCLAYANYHKPPRKIEKMPDNVRVQVCLYGAMTLPLTHPANAAMKERLEEWYRKCPRLDTYSYVLIHGGRMPVPLVTAMSDWMQSLQRYDALGGGTQASEWHLPINPWSFYAFPRYVWKPDTLAETILQDFLSSYYRGASVPMQSYYRTLEEHVLKESINLQEGPYGYGPKPEAFTPSVLGTMDEHLSVAEKEARLWFVKERVGTARECYDWTVLQAARRREGPENAEARGKQLYPCHRLDGAIKIDGECGDEAWQKHPLATGFVIPGRGRVALARQSEFRMAWDDKNLYVAVRCQEPNAEHINVASTKGAVFFKDSIEMFLAPKLAAPTPYYRLAISASGTSEGPDLYLGDMYNRVKREQPACEVAARTGKGFWACEAAIPWEGLGGAPDPGATWLGNICRNTRVVGDTGEQFTSWTHLPRVHWHKYREYNSIRFEPKAMTADETKSAEQKLNVKFREVFSVLLPKHEAVENAIKAAQGSQNLAVNEKGTPSTERIALSCSGGLWVEQVLETKGNWRIDQVGPQYCELTWPRGVELDTVILRFVGVPTWYSLDYWDGQQYRLLVDERDNELEIRAHRFAPMQATRLRLHLIDPQMGPRGVRRIEVYRLTTE